MTDNDKCDRCGLNFLPDDARYPADRQFSYWHDTEVCLERSIQVNATLTRQIEERDKGASDFLLDCSVTAGGHEWGDLFRNHYPGEVYPGNLETE